MSLRAAIRPLPAGPQRLRGPAARLLMGLLMGLLLWPLGASAMSVCQSGAVEMIVGGSAPTACSPPAGVSALSSNPPLRGVAVAGRERVDAAAQRERDSDRRRILESEWQREQGSLADLLRQGASADGAQLARTRANLQALRAELDRLPR